MMIFHIDFLSSPATKSSRLINISSSLLLVTFSNMPRLEIIIIDLLLIVLCKTHTNIIIQQQNSIYQYSECQQDCEVYPEAYKNYHQTLLF